jgi:hypothetical protein
MKYLFAFFISHSTFAQNIPQCPSESYLIEYTSPVTRLKKSFCGYLKDGNTIKHGDEFIYDAKGEVIQKISHNHGKEAETPVAQGHQLPEMDESSKKFIDSIVGKKNLNPDEKLLASIHELIEILNLKKNYGKKNRFKANGCDDRPTDWLKGALLNTPIKKTYIFKDECDAAGSFEARFSTEFPMNFQLRNLEDLNNARLKVIMSLNKKDFGIRYKFVVVEGTVSSPSRRGQFTAEYEVDIDPMTGEAQKGTQAGKITLIKVNDKEINLTKNIEF